MDEIKNYSIFLIIPRIIRYTLKKKKIWGIIRRLVINLKRSWTVSWSSRVFSFFFSFSQKCTLSNPRKMRRSMYMVCLYRFDRSTNCSTKNSSINNNKCEETDKSRLTCSQLTYINAKLNESKPLWWQKIISSDGRIIT